jgi:hypothetical protein
MYGLDARAGKVLWENAEAAVRSWEVWSVKGLVTSNLDIFKRARARDPDIYKFERESNTNPPERNMPAQWLDDGD